MPVGAPRIAGSDAVIRNSGSTNVAGFTIVVHPDFSADVYGGATPRHALLAAAQAKWLFAKLGDDEPFSSLEGGRCMKSASFGTTLTITYRGQTTPDLSCPGGAEVRELGRTAEAIADRLGVAPAMNRLRRALPL